MGRRLACALLLLAAPAAAASPAPPVFTSPPPLTANPAPAAAGTADPGSRVEVQLDGHAVGSAGVNANGRWSQELGSVADGAHTVIAVEVEASGDRSLATTLRFVVDTSPPPAPSLDSPRDQESYLALPVVRGAAIASVTIRVTFDAAPLAELRSDAAGAFTVRFPPAQRIGRGNHVVSVVAIDEAGNVSVPASYLFFLAVAQAGVDPEPLVAGGQFTCATLDGPHGATTPAPLVLIALATAVLAWALVRRSQRRRAMGARGEGRRP